MSWLDDYLSSSGPRQRRGPRPRDGWDLWYERERRAGRITKSGLWINTTENLREQARKQRRQRRKVENYGIEYLSGRGKPRTARLSRWEAEQFILSFNRKRQTPVRNSALCAALLYLDIPVEEVLHLPKDDHRLDDLPPLGQRLRRRWCRLRSRLCFRFVELEFPALEVPRFGAPMTASNLRHCLRRQSQRIGWPCVGPRALRVAGRNTTAPANRI